MHNYLSSVGGSSSHCTFLLFKQPPSNVIGGRYMASLKAKQKAYQAKYSDIPLDLNERLNWMIDQYKINHIDYINILQERDRRMHSLYYTTIRIILYQEPQGAKRPRYRFINRSNVLSAAKMDPGFIHVYSPDAASNHQYMKRVVEENEFENLSHIICTPCDVSFRAYFHTPSDYNKVETFMAEIGLDRPIVKPDWDNIGKLYSDMYNSNVWIDDALTIRGCVDKLYSILPRVEIDLCYLNAVYNKKQYNNIVKRKDYTDDMQLCYI